MSDEFDKQIEEKYKKNGWFDDKSIPSDIAELLLERVKYSDSSEDRAAADYLRANINKERLVASK